MEHQDSSPLDRLVAKFTKANDHELTPVCGMVEECHVIQERNRKIFIIHLKNGSLSSSFWVAQNRYDAFFDPPRTGDQLSGVVNTLDDNVEFCGQSYKPLFDFTNHSTSAEREAFAWFARQAEQKRRNDPDGNAPS